MRKLSILITALLITVVLTGCRLPGSNMTTGTTTAATATTSITTTVSNSTTTESTTGLTAVTTYRNLVYATIGQSKLLLDLYLPQSSTPLPLIIWIHGGGWISGNKENPLPERLEFTRRGYAIASINYRLTGETSFPAQIEDCKAAVRWLRANAVLYNLDPERFGAWGSSAGGHLVALLGTSGGIQELEGMVGGNSDQSSHVQAVCDYYGPSDLLTMASVPGFESQMQADSAIGKLIGGALARNEDKARAASPVTHISPDDPPFFIVHGDSDFTVPVSQSQLLYDKLRQSGVEATLRILQGARHGGAEFSNPELVVQIAGFFDRYLKS